MTAFEIGFRQHTVVFRLGAPLPQVNVRPVLQTLRESAFVSSVLRVVKVTGFAMAAKRASERRS